VAAAGRHFEEARRSLEESLRIRKEHDDKPRLAESLSQLADIDLLCGDLTTAERNAQAAREIRESLGLKEAFRDYGTLAKIAAARGDTAAAAEWARKRDDLHAELERPAGGGRAFSAQTLRALEALILACARTGFGGETLDPAVEENLAQMDAAANPFPAFSGVLRQLAGGHIPPVPAGLPKELHELLHNIIQAIREPSA
jgi:hypothetical protein